MDQLTDDELESESVIFLGGFMGTGAVVFFASNEIISLIVSRILPLSSLPLGDRFTLLLDDELVSTLSDESHLGSPASPFSECRGSYFDDNRKDLTSSHKCIMVRYGYLCL